MNGGFGRRAEVADEAARQEPGPDPTGDPGPDPAADSVHCPTSFAQERLWFLDQLRPGAVDYLLPLALRIGGPLDPEALVRAVQAVLERHEVLRTRYPAVHGAPVQEIARQAELPFEHVDLTHLPPEQREAGAREIVDRGTRRPFDLATELPLRLTLVRLAEDEHLLFLLVHHIAMDGWSWDVLARELDAFYGALSGSGGPAPEPLPVQYADFALWQREYLSGERLEGQLAYWRDRLAGLQPLVLPTDRPRPAVWDAAGDAVDFELDPELVKWVRALAREHGATPFMVLLAAYQALLARHSGQHDIAVGTPVAGRPLVEVEDLLGFFANTLVLRADLSGSPSFLDLLAQVRETALDAFAHQDLPFERLVDELAPERELSGNPLFRASFVLQNAASRPFTLPGLDVQPYPAGGAGAAFDLTLQLLEDEGGALTASLRYADALFDRTTAARLAEHYVRLLRGVLADPGAPLARAELLSAEERTQLVDGWNDTATEFPSGACVHELFEQQAARTPQAVAVASESGSLTYAELDACADRLAHRLRASGVGPEVLVALRLRRGPALVVAVLAVLKAGGGYLPTDPGHPAARVLELLTDSAAAVLLTEDGLGPAPEGWPGRTLLLGEDAADPTAQPLVPAPAAGAPAAPDNTAYVIYTSGSTGRPKGVVITHRNLVNYVTWAAAAYRTGGWGTPLYSSLAFDLPVTSLFPALLSGSTVTLTPDGGTGLDELARALREDSFDLVKLTPAHLAVLGAALPPGALSGTARLVVGGEILTGRQLDPWARHAPDTVVINEYGPTEATVGCCVFECRAADLDPGAVPIGRPIANTRLFVLDEELAPVPVGVVGELYIGGAGLARGYLGRPGLTADRFVPDPFSAVRGDRLYRTGDLVRYRADGVLECLGRVDDQVKIRGYRIEPGEIEAVLNEHPAVRGSAVAVQGEPDDRRLVAYLVAAEGARPDPDELRDHLARRLPEHMVPTVFTALPAIPLGASGKVDRAALPHHAAGRLESARAHLAPRTELERGVAAVWAEFLDVPRIGVHDDFFALGGHSLLATRVAFRLREEFGVELALSEVFAARTVARLAELIAADDGRRHPAVRRVDRDLPLPLSFAQQRMWFLDRLAPGATDYLVPVPLRLGGPLDERALRAALDELLSRHEVLRTRYVEQGDALVALVDPPGPLPLHRLDAADSSPQDGAARMREIVEQDLGRPFDLARQLPVRATLARFADQDHLLLLTLHHIVADAWSLDVLAGELRDLYAAFRAGDGSPLAAPALQYADFAGWQRDWAEGPAQAGQLAFWRERLAGAATLELPTDRPRPATRDPRGHDLLLTVPAEVARPVVEFGRRHGATPFMVLLAAFQALLGRYTGQQDIVVGTPVAGRGHAELQGLVGLCVNTLVLRADLSGDPSFAGLLARVRDGALAAYAHQDLPFEQLVDELAPQRDLSRNPLFQVAFEVRQAAGTPFALAGLRVEPVEVAWPVAKFDLMLSVEELPDGALRCWFEYATALFDQESVQRLADHYLRLLAGLAADPDRPLSRLELLAAPELRQLEQAARGAVVRRPDRCLHELVAEQAAATPGATAVVHGTTEWTYRRLDERADRLARHLISLGAGPEVRVAVGLRRGPDLVTALLAVLKAGSTYVPLDPEHPAARREHMLRDSGAALLIGDASAALPGFPVDVLLDGGDPDWSTARDDTALPAVDPAGAAYAVYTSGSTGLPKGVLVTHEGIRNRVLWTVERHGLSAGDRVLQKTSIGFDAAMWEFLAPLVSGGTIVLAPDGAHRDPAAMVRAMTEHGVTVLQLVPSVLSTLVEQPELADCTSLRLVCCAGEPLPARLCERLLELVPVELYNTYGPTECSIDVTAWRYQPDPEARTVSIGLPLDNLRILVLDGDDNLVPVGVPGELTVAGVALARGYLGRPGLTAERFTPNPFPQEPGDGPLLPGGGQGGRLYRTGDRVRRHADGRLEYLGRLDAQLKVRGVRIEPGEVESALCAHPAVTAAVVGVHRRDEGDHRLVAHVVPAPGAALDPQRLRAHLTGRLPEAMIPTAFVLLERLPLTASGKVDRAALPAPDLDRAQSAGEYVAPRSPVEQTLAVLFADVLGVRRVGAHDDFFTLGGHSLLATRLAFRVRTALGVELPLAEVFALRTPARLAELIETGYRGVELPPITPVGGDGPLPLSSAQQRLWFLDRLEPGSAEYLVPTVLRLTGELDERALSGALTEVVARHRVLRTRYTEQAGVPAQLVDRPGPVEPAVVDLRGACERDVRFAVAQETALPFDLERELPLRAALLRTGDAEWLFVLTLHHIATDAWSTDVITRELWSCYQAFRADLPVPLAPLTVQYSDFAQWQLERLGEPVLADQLAYWQQRLAGLQPLELPTDRPRPAVRDPRGALLTVDVPADLGPAVAALARARSATPFMVLLAAFQVLLARYSGQQDIAVGTPVAGRTRAETEDLVGLFVNTVVLRADLSAQPTFGQLLDQVRADAVQAYAHQDLPFERVVDELRPERDLSRNPLFQVMFDLLHAPQSPPELDGLGIEQLGTDWQVAKFDLTVSLGERADGSLECLFEYSTALFDRSTVRRMADHYLRLLRSALDAPDTRVGELAMVTDPERRQLLDDWSGRPAERPRRCVPELVAARAAAAPHALAAVFAGEDASSSLSYGELDARANQLAHHLGTLGVGPESVVGVCMERGTDVLVALLGVLKAGGCYVPFDPAHPAERLSFMLDDAGVQVVLTHSRFADRVAGGRGRVVRLDGDRAQLDRQPATAPEVTIDPGQLAYAIYTSGSTGQPKGVLIQHDSYAHHCEVIADAYGIGPDDRVVLLSALTFDVAMDQMAATLLAGATVVVSDPLFWSPAELPDRLAQHRVTIMEITPAYYRELVAGLAPGDQRLGGLRLMNVGSDVVTVDDARSWAATGLPARFLCNYGPTEATVTCVLHPVAGDPAGARGESTLPIGRPVPGTTAYILDPDLNPVPVGVPGELYLGGIRLARGYHRRPGLTGERFVPDPFGGEPGGRLYRTGDLVRYAADGTIEFLGRIDQQVKIRGFRIELGEIEAVLAQHPRLRAVAVVAREVQPGDRRLVAYLVGEDGTVPDPAELRLFLGDQLPEYMIPSLWVPLAELPLTSSKKVDRRALPTPEPDRAQLTTAYLAPRTPLETALAGIWADILRLDRVGVDDGFFDLGGHSLLATRVLAQIRQAFGVDLPLRRLFEAPTVALLAESVEQAVEAQIAELSDEEVERLLAAEGE
ncbi:non-ribosomal peptide synthetase [Kitasatospora viridis]|uniref:Amino acid adenylation domain-containing protein n=1 Tax=Kitasatospora viridis TaxID=281105 RepID=A0A561T6D7_9ACTN|nr:non-ribosomal peptide synthetase [Kitasatospora viridis]TWF82686.1 amino acid adenylation domain-containing protein [Kitasatospora viridis]